MFDWRANDRPTRPKNSTRIPQTESAPLPIPRPRRRAWRAGAAASGRLCPRSDGAAASHSEVEKAVEDEMTDKVHYKSDSNEWDTK